MSEPPKWDLPSLPRQYADASGIMRVRPHLERVELPRGIVVPRPVIVATTEPSSFEDQLHSYTTATELLENALDPEWARILGVPPLTKEAVVEAAASVPFEPAMRFLASLQKEVFDARRSQPRQVALMRALYGDVLAVSAATLVRDRPERALFTEQALFALQRLLVLHARDDPADDLTPEEYELLRWALLWVPDTILEPQLDLDTDEEVDLTDERWLRFFVGHGGLTVHNSLRHELARAYRLYVVIANSCSARRRKDYCPLDRWLRDRFGVSFVELQVMGFGLFAGSKIRDDESPPVLVDAAYYAPTRLAHRVKGAFEALAAPREWFRDEFIRSGEHPRRAGFETQPFLRRPGLRQRDGRIAVLAPRAIEAWLSSTGTYYRFNDLARDLGDHVREQFGTFNGFLLERYALHLAYVAHPDQPARRALAVGRVFGDRPYPVRHGQSRTNDVTIDYGLDLVLIDVTAKRVTERSLVEASAESILRDLRMMLLAKAKQLGRVIRDLDRGVVAFENVDMSFVTRIWPIIVSPENVLQNPSLWSWLDREAAPYLNFDDPALRAKRQPLVLLDLEEYEGMMGLARAEHNLIGVLESKTSDEWRHRDFKVWLDEHGKEAVLVKKDFIAEEVSRAFRAMVVALDAPRRDSAPRVGRRAA